MDRGKQVVKKGVWYIGGKRKKKEKTKKGGAIPLGLIASFARSLLGEIVKPIFKKRVGGRRPIRRRRRIAVWKIKQ